MNAYRILDGHSWKGTRQNKRAQKRNNASKRRCSHLVPFADFRLKLLTTLAENLSIPLSELTLKTPTSSKSESRKSTHSRETCLVSIQEERLRPSYLDYLELIEASKYKRSLVTSPAPTVTKTGTRRSSRKSDASKPS